MVLPDQTYVKLEVVNDIPYLRPGSATSRQNPLIDKVCCVCKARVGLGRGVADSDKAGVGQPAAAQHARFGKPTDACPGDAMPVPVDAIEVDAPPPAPEYSNPEDLDGKAAADAFFLLPCAGTSGKKHEVWPTCCDTSVSILTVRLVDAGR